MEKTSKKIIGGLMVVMILATIGALIASAQTDETSEEDTQQTPFWGRRLMYRQPPFFSELTEEQQAELEALRQQLRDQNATCEEIKTAIQAKLEEWGVEHQIPELTDEELDERLDNAIEHTKQRLEILNRTKELREEGYSWEEIKDIIQDEFDLEFPVGDGLSMILGPGFRRGACRGPHDFMSSE